MVAAGQDAGAGLRRRFWLQGEPDQCRYSPMGPVPGSLMASGWGSPQRAARAVAAPVLPFRVAVITCWRLRAKCRRRMSFQAGPRRCCRPRRWRRSAGSARAGPFAPELRCPRACGSPAAPSADVVHRWCDARTDHDYRVPKRAIKIRNQASCTRRRRRQGEAGPANLLRSLTTESPRVPRGPAGVIQRGCLRPATRRDFSPRRGCPRSGPSGFAGPPRCHDRADRRATHRACDEERGQAGKAVGAGRSWPWRHSGGSALGHVVLLRLLYLFGDCLTHQSHW